MFLQFEQLPVDGEKRDQTHWYQRGWVEGRVLAHSSGPHRSVKCRESAFHSGVSASLPNPQLLLLPQLPCCKDGISWTWPLCCCLSWASHWRRSRSMRPSPSTPPSSVSCAFYVLPGVSGRQGRDKQEWEGGFPVVYGRRSRSGVGDIEQVSKRGPAE